MKKKDTKGKVEQEIVDLLGYPELNYSFKIVYRIPGLCFKDESLKKWKENLNEEESLY